MNQKKICPYCGKEFNLIDNELSEHSIFDYFLCKNCYKYIRSFMKGIIRMRTNRILWGPPWAIQKGHWQELKRFLQGYNIRTILEYGCGLSTELLILDGYKVTCLEPLKWFGELFKKIVYKNIFIYDQGPNLRGIHDFVFNKMFDFALVDAPSSYQRKEEVIHATQYSSKFIYLHNPTENQVSALEKVAWLPMTEWSKSRGYHRFWRRG